MSDWSTSTGPMSEERLDFHLQNWAAWQRSYRPRLGAHLSSVFISGRSREFDEMVAEVDNRCAHAVDAIIDGLTARERAAIHHHYTGAVWRIRGDIEESYIEARMTIATLLTRRGIF